MRSIEVSDEVYDGLAGAAARRGISINAYLAQTLDDSQVVFSRENLEAIDRGLADADAGRTSSWDEATSWVKEKARRAASQGS